MSLVKAYVDGACVHGQGGIGVVFRSQGEELDDFCEAIGDSTNNIAEYKAVIRALEQALVRGYLYFEVYSDSLLVVNQVNRDWAVNKPHLKVLYERVKELKKGFKSIKFIWISRAFNKRADFLSKYALEESGVLEGLKGQSRKDCVGGFWSGEI